ncbi:5646_t:CDS:2 [Ambispora gerdemannii]|uniref:5646_t:CDS:1 n=1 Tax=Ambispora gerdemannii TaxID=144530 RepID=A0A9N9D126_9GLOM|nr:5646_t:CDS:2 [Ambispora gerdemannii]
MDFFKTDVDEWTCENAIKYYRENNVQLNFNQILDTINKDLKRISKSGSDATRREKAESIIVNWKKLNNSWLFGYELLVPAKPYTLGQSEWTKNVKEDKRMKDLITECNILMAEQHNEVVRTAVVRDQVVRTTLARQLENFKDEHVQLSARKRHNLNDFEEGFSTPPNKNPSTIRDFQIIGRYEDENVASDLKEKAQRSTTPFLPKKRARNTQQEAEKGITDEDLVDSVIDASNTFGKVEFPSYYSKLKSIWNNQDATNYHVIDLGDKDTLYKVHDLLDEDELKSLFKRLVLDDEDMHINEKTRKYIELFDQIVEEENLEDICDDVVVDEVDLVNENNEETKNMKGDNEKFNKSIAKMKEIVHQLDGLPEKYHYLSNTFPMSAQYYDQSKMPDMFIVKSISSHLDTIIKMNGAMKNTPEQLTISTKIDVQENNFKADGVLEFFERPMQIPLFLLEVSEGPNNPDPDKINEDRQKLMNEGVFAINNTLKIFLAQGFGDNVEIGQMIFIGPGLYLFSPFTIPALVIPTSTDNLEHVPRLIRTFLCLRYNVLKEVRMFEKFAKEGQRHIAKPKTKYPTGVTPERPKAVTFAEFLPKISKEGERNRGRGRGRGWGGKDSTD